VTDPAIVKAIVKQILNDPAPSIERKQTRQEPASPPFDKDKDIFHKIAYGISQLTGQRPTVTYDYPTEEEALGQSESAAHRKVPKNRGGKVTSKRPTTKKYAMNRGGKVASVRKPTRA
jgi:hypothetical protein